MANLNDTITDGSAKFKVVKAATSNDVSDHNSLATAHSNGISGNAATATKFAAAKTIWGQSFDGSGNVSGNMTGVGIISASGSITCKGLHSLPIDTGNEGGQAELLASKDTYNGIILDNRSGVFRIFGIASADGTTKTGHGTPLEIDPYAKTIKGSYTFIGDVTGNINNHTVLSDVPANAKFTDTTYSVATESVSGLMAAADKIKTNNLVHSAGAHNALYRGNDLTEYFDSGQMSTDIASGNFINIYPGDYIIKSITVPGEAESGDDTQTPDEVTYNNVKFIVGDLNYHIYRGGGTRTKTNHVLMFSEDALGLHIMNKTNTTEGGYLGSDMWLKVIPRYATAIKNAFGANHVLKHRELLSNAVNADTPSAAYSAWSGASSSSVWTDVEVNIFNEPMIYGNYPNSSSKFDIGECDTQIAAMRHNKSLSFNHSKWCWLRAVVSARIFSYASDAGYANHAGDQLSRGVRPYFLLY